MAAGGVQLDVPFFRQEKKGCGAASVAMVVHYWEKQHPGLELQSEHPRKVHEQLYATEVGGIRLSDMKRYLHERGFHAFTLRASWADIEAHLFKRRPVIACLKKGGRSPLHYAVVVGFESERVWINDPAKRKRKALKRSSFEKRWAAADHWVLLAVPRQPTALQKILSLGPMAKARRGCRAAQS